MSTKRLSAEEWHGYFERLNRSMPAHEIRIEALSLEIGDQVDADHEVASRVDYNPASRELHISGSHRGHLVFQPSEISVVEEAGDLKAIEAIDRDNVRYVFTFKLLPSLPSAGKTNLRGKKSDSKVRRRRQKSAEVFSRRESPEPAVCDRCGISFPYVREMAVNEEELETDILCSDCRAALNAEGGGYVRH